MLKINTYNNSHLINFGTNARDTNVQLAPDRPTIKTCDYFFRHDESHPQKVGDFLIHRAMNSKNTEMKIAGSADMSKFLARTIAMHNTLGAERYKKLFPDIELIDINQETMERARQGIVPMISEDFKAIRRYLSVDPSKYFTPVTDSNKYFLSGDGTYNQTNTAHCKVADCLLDGVKFTNADVRQVIPKLGEPNPNTFRILEFSNGWYILPQRDQIDLAFDMAEKTKLGDAVIVGRCELIGGVGDLLERVGFRRELALKEIFIKVKDMSRERMHDLKGTLRECTYLVR